MAIIRGNTNHNLNLAIRNRLDWQPGGPLRFNEVARSPITLDRLIERGNVKDSWLERSRKSTRGSRSVLALTDSRPRIYALLAPRLPSPSPPHPNPFLSRTLPLHPHLATRSRASVPCLPRAAVAVSLFPHFISPFCLIFLTPTTSRSELPRHDAPQTELSARRASRDRYAAPCSELGQFLILLTTARLLSTHETRSA